MTRAPGSYYHRLATPLPRNWHFTVSYNTGNQQSYQAHRKLPWSQPSKETLPIPYLSPPSSVLTFSSYWWRKRKHNEINSDDCNRVETVARWRYMIAPHKRWLDCSYWKHREREMVGYICGCGRAETPGMNRAGETSTAVVQWRADINKTWTLVKKDPPQDSPRSHSTPLSVPALWTRLIGKRKAATTTTTRAAGGAAAGKQINKQTNR